MGIKAQLEAYKNKYYLNKAIKGILVWLASVSAVFFLINSIEFSARFNELGRAILFFSFVSSAGIGAYFLFIRYILIRNSRSQQLSNRQVAQEIGQFFPEISDKLLNLIQLEELSQDQNELLSASIAQKTKEISHISFTEAIDLRNNKKYVRFILPPLLAIILVLVFVPKMITESTKRIVNFNLAYVPEAPFSFQLSENELIGFQSEAYTLNFRTFGNTIPENAFVDINGRKVMAKNNGNGLFSYTFDRLVSDLDFKLEGGGITSADYRLRVVQRPVLESFEIDLNYPKHTQLEQERIKNSGNLKIPEGTEVLWKLKTTATNSATIKLRDKQIKFEEENQAYVFDSTFKASTAYSLELQNNYAFNKDSLSFAIDIIKDQYPKISLEQYQDTVLYRDIVFAGQIQDDYGFKALKLHYAYEGEDAFQSLELSITPTIKDQTYYYVFKLDSAEINAGGALKYYIEVIDNDQVNGFKRSKTGTYSFQIPSKEEIAAEVAQGNQQVKQEINKSLQKANELQESIKALDERLKTKKELDWQDEKMMSDILKQKEQLSERLEQLKKENQQNNEKQNQFQPTSDNVQQKMQQLQEIMDNVLDEETRKLYEELRDLLEEQSDIEEFREKVEELNNNSQNLEEDLERTLELFKKLQFDMKLEENIEKMEEAIEAQEALNEETKDEAKNAEDLKKAQEEEKEKTESLQEELNELNELNQERKNPEALPEDLNEELEEIKEEQQEAEEALAEEEAQEASESNGEETQEEEENQKGQKSPNQRQKASKAQQRAVQKMKEVKESLSSMQSAMEMEQQQENLNNLRDLVDNLVKLSFSQEALMNEFDGIRQSDPRFVDLSQRQLKIQDDSKIVQDSLVSLSQRVFQISSFVMKELDKMNTQMDGTVNALKEKNISQAIGKQQFTMTSINNLALLLDDVLQNLQEQMSAQSGGSSKQKGQKNMPMAGLSELQKKLSEQIQQIKKSGKSGRELSEELAKLAAQQERLRNALENFETGLDGNKLGEKIDKLVEQMELNEMDLLNKNVTDETVERQRDILTRMLDAQNAIEQRGEDEKREAQTAYDYELSVPESMLEYLKQKEKEIELLRTIPTKLNPYYKKETNKYFNKIKNQK